MLAMISQQLDQQQNVDASTTPGEHPTVTAAVAAAQPTAASRVPFAIHELLGFGAACNFR
jgi:hypothetical protein